MPQIAPVDEVHILSTYAESIFYGAFVVMYGACVWVLVKGRDSTRRINKLMLCTATAMIIVATLFEAVSIQRDIEAFFEHKNSSPVAYYDTSSNFANLYQSTLWVIQVLIGDSLLVYRMYIVYSRQLLVVALPITMLIASAVCGINVIYQFSLVDASLNPNFFTQNVAPWTTSIVAVTFAQNVISTLAIALRLWWVGRRVGKWFGGRHWASITVFLESGLPYTLTLTILTILHLREQNFYDIAYYGLVPISGISFTALIIRVGLRNQNEVVSSRSKESSYPHKHKPQRVSRSMRFAPVDSAQTQGTFVSTTSGESSTTHANSVAIPKLDMEMAVLPPLRSFQSRFTLPAPSEESDEHDHDHDQSWDDKPARTEEDYY